MFDSVVHLGDIAVTSGLAVVGYGLRQVYTKISSFVDRVQAHEDELGDTVEVVDTHSRLLIRGGLAKGEALPRLSHRRRKSDTVFVGEDV